MLSLLYGRQDLRLLDNFGWTFCASTCMKILWCFATLLRLQILIWRGEIGEKIPVFFLLKFVWDFLLCLTPFLSQEQRDVAFLLPSGCCSFRTWLVRIFRLCGAILLNETSLTTQEARWMFAVCLGVAKSMYFLTLLQAILGFFLWLPFDGYIAKVNHFEHCLWFNGSWKVAKKRRDMWVGFFPTEFCFGWSTAGRLWLQGLAPPDSWLCCVIQLQDADGFISTFIGFLVLGIKCEFTHAVSDKLKSVSFL